MPISHRITSSRWSALSIRKRTRGSWLRTKLTRQTPFSLTSIFVLSRFFLFVSFYSSSFPQTYRTHARERFTWPSFTMVASLARWRCVLGLSYRRDLSLSLPFSPFERAAVKMCRNILLSVSFRFTHNHQIFFSINLFFFDVFFSIVFARSIVEKYQKIDSMSIFDLSLIFLCSARIK